MPQLEIEKIKPGSNTRLFFDGIVELSETIEESGWISPITVNKKTLEIVRGERRWRAATYLNDNARRKGEKPPWPKMPVEWFEGDEREEFSANVAENAARQELRFIEWARIFQKYRENYGLSNDEISKKTGYDSATVSRYISILEKTHPDIIKRLDNGEQIPVSLLISIHTIRNKDTQLLRLDQWYGKPAAEGTVTESKQRTGKLNRKRLIALLKLLQEKGASQETVEVVQFIAGMRQTLPNKLHLQLGQKRVRQRQE